uniref:Putative enzyme of poly-gamma-glutamate biosynthesis (Capsule formation)-like protein n=1 Tax=Chlorobium chlorochromatii (strain CaD3) TaxID=340177 RepID=Q3AST4_CHLCH
MTLKLLACGDVVNFSAKQDFVDNKLTQIIQNSDIAICNFEAPIFHQDMRPIKKAGPHVYQSKESVQYLKNVGFNFVSLANNHIYDYRQKGIFDTIQELKKFDLEFIGGGTTFEEAYKTTIIEKNGITIGLLAGCENEFGCLYEEQNRGGYAWLFHHKIEDNIRELKAKCDFIVFISHAGVEDIELPIKEWRDRYQRLCDVGVDVIIGHHPHVPQGYEKHNKSLIFYSLGNFYFDTTSFKNKSDDSFSLLIEFEKNKNIGFEIIYHKKINGQTVLVDKKDVSFDLDYLCGILEDGYLKRNDEISIELFNKYYYRYYQEALGVIACNLNFLSQIKWLIKKIIFSKKEIDNKNLMLLHNIRIDSHRFIVQRALSLLSERI